MSVVTVRSTFTEDVKTLCQDKTNILIHKFPYIIYNSKYIYVVLFYKILDNYSINYMMMFVLKYSYILRIVMRVG